MIPFIYDTLLFLMLYVLYRSGKGIAKTGKIISLPGFMAIIVYTLNEGLRFGRGIDYNLYGMSYEELERTGESDWDISFQYIARILINWDIPWQGYVLFMSFVFILAALILLKNCREVLPYALPFFVLFSISETENMVRWYLGFSFIMIGLGYLLGEGRNKKTKFLLFSLFACTFHLALLPLPLAFFLLSLRKKPLLSPIWTLFLYFAIVLFFQTDFMLRFVELVNILSLTLGESSERLAHYGDRAEYWLTGGFAGTEEHSALPPKSELLFLCCLVLVGYQIIKRKGQNYVFSYNIFIVGFLVYPLARQIELLVRFDQPFMFFRAIVLASILTDVFVRKVVRVNPLAYLLSMLIILNMGRHIIVKPFMGNSGHYLYVWDSKGKNYQSMYDMWIDDMLDADTKKRRQKKLDDYE